MIDDDHLSIHAAAAEAGDRPGLITARRTWTFAELAAACASVTLAPPAADDRAIAVAAHPEAATVLTLYAALAARRPVALLHPRAAAAELDVARAAVAAHPAPPGTLAIVFTSGSTGTPRGAVLPRAGIVASAAASAANLGAPPPGGDRWLGCLPLAHTGGLTVVLRALIARAPLVLHDAPFDAAAVARLAADHRVTLASLVPTQLDALLASPSWPPPTLRAVLLGGAAAAPALLDRAAARGVPVRRTYGLTETWGQVATAPAAGAAPRALSGVTLRAGTAEAPAPIVIDAPWALTGWLGEPPRPPGAPVVTTDLGWLDGDGGVHVVGRADDVIITGGENVHPAQVEAALAGAPGVAAACAVGVPDPRWGQVVAAAIVAAPGLDRAALAAWIDARLPSHHRPRRLVVVDALPLGPTGKVDRRAVARQLEPA